MAGADCKKVSFLFTDEQIKDESFLEDISMVLNTGEVPNLFATDEKTEILERVQVINPQFNQGWESRWSSWLHTGFPSRWPGFDSGPGYNQQTKKIKTT